MNMRSLPWTVPVAILCALISLAAKSDGFFSPQNSTNLQTFTTRGIIRDLRAADSTIVIQHDAISNYMPAMTMPFRVRGRQILSGLNTNDVVQFELHVTRSESWVDHIIKTGAKATVLPAAAPAVLPPVSALSQHPLLDYKFTNELGQSVSLNDFRGQALAVTFFYTRCPLPEYCPRLSRNFQEAQQKLEAMTNAPANWHLVSITFEPEVDTPERLRYYGQSFLYDPKHWSFLTGPADKIAELAHASGVDYEPDAGTINHNFRTLIVDATGHLQMIFPTSGDLSDQIVAQLLKAAAVTDPAAAATQK